MKKIITIFTTVILIFSLVGCDFKVGVKDRSGNYGGSIDEEISLNDIDKISISIDVGELEIDTYDGENLKITGSLGNENDKYSVSNKSGNIEFRVKTKKKITLYNQDDTTKIKVLVPNSYKSDYNIDTGAGQANINNISGEKVDIDAGAGDIRIKNIKFSKLDYDAGVGASKIYLADASGDINISGGVGEIIVELAEVGGDLTCDAGVGSTRIKVPENAPIKFKKSSGIGDCVISATTSGEEKYVFDISVGVGEVEIYN